MLYPTFIRQKLDASSPSRRAFNTRFINGARVSASHDTLPGLMFIFTEKGVEHWAYQERRHGNQMLEIVTSKGWKPWMYSISDRGADHAKVEVCDPTDYHVALVRKRVDELQADRMEQAFSGRILVAARG